MHRRDQVVHRGLMHILFNMLTLFFTYQLFNRYFEDRRFINVYFVSGLAGALRSQRASDARAASSDAVQSVS